MFKKVMSVITRIEKYLLAVTMSVTLAFTFANVIGRFVFNHSLAFADELVVALFVLVSLMGAALCARENDGLIGLSLLSSRLTGSKKTVQKLFSGIVCIIYCIILTWQGFIRMTSSMQQGEHTFVMHLPRWIFWSFIPVCGIFLILHFIENLLDFLAAKKNQEASK
ncbi:TRAP transporter small permease [uncultured Treponema sp.]|uniref:TRAP transporter small permease n=1 Tax=uncultured Treponema sp. TaxID=162155 RepID=UPI0025DD26C2|nr:TRAP transporter small permease [uncultured Treponema sp.]